MYNISDIYSLFEKSNGVCTDTRLIKGGELFFGLKGDNFDGSKYAKQAIEKGCKYAIVDNQEYANNEKIFFVEDSLKCLQELSNYHRKELGTKIISITGTNGKTTTKELLASVLQEKFSIVYTIGNLNNHIGVPLSLLNIKKDTEIAVIEMGANHPGEIDFLCKIAQPDYGLITNIGKAHLEGFGSFEGVIQTKTEMYRYLKDKNAKAFVNQENEILNSNIPENLEIIKYNDFDCKLRILQASPFVVVEISDKLGKLYIKTKLIGAYNFENIAAAISVGKYFGVDNLKIKSALEKYQPNNNRSQLKKTERNILYLDAYNANPSSMKEALNNFSNLNSPNKTIILGDMRELGSYSQAEHLKIINQLQNFDINRIILVGEEFGKHKTEKIEFFKSCEELLESKILNDISNNHILIKGSRGIKLERLEEQL
ncbi:MAG: UDP-N-acetylmuramoyl-tripeptide--D-alanyl-D-alanine ligase [Marinifilaceae bacterium]|jgi:UDP-N-acetylmuramoyl-tripeptide--D-alanyl-D-alanine ligase|nr:UDP-N-acetylmuramoyl-tripeptide--D-alanyl-D-alanine ligase [Marinifilaceae bacterium]